MQPLCKSFGDTCEQVDGYILQAQRFVSKPTTEYRFARSSSPLRQDACPQQLLYTQPYLWNNLASSVPTFYKPVTVRLCCENCTLKATVVFVGNVTQESAE